VPITSRQFEDEADYGRMRRLLTAIQPLVGTRVYCTIGEIDWWRFTDDDPDAAMRRARLWFDGDDLVAFSWPDNEQIDFFHPDYGFLQDEMLAWSVPDHRARHGAESTMTTFAFASDPVRQDHLRRHGFAPSDDYLVLRTRSLTDPLPAPILPEGFTLRHVAGPQEAEARVAVHRAAFTQSKMTAEKYRRVMAAPTYRPDLDLVAVAPDGTLAAFAIVWWDEVNRRGVFEPLGTAAAFQNRGLGRAIVAEGSRRLRGLGAESAWITSSSNNPAANALYDRAGFPAVDRCVFWHRSVES
jgi:mycothiol synthase